MDRSIPSKFPRISPHPVLKNPIFRWILLSLLLPVSSQRDSFSFAGFNNISLSLSGVAGLEDSGILRLTEWSPMTMGHAFYRVPLAFKSAPNGSTYSFSTAFAFAIVPKDASPIAGHGLAFAIAPSEDLKDALPSQYLGLLDTSNNGNASNHLLAVEFDTVGNFEFGDINDNHVGININSMISAASASAADVTYFGDHRPPYRYESYINLKSGDTIQAWVDYDGVNKVLNVTISPSSTKPIFPLLSFPVDLSPILQERMFVGFSASTGTITAHHYLFGWNFVTNGMAPSLNLSSLPSLSKPTKENTAFIIAASAAASFIVIAAAAAAYLFYRIKNADDVIEPWELDCGPHRFSYGELKLATNGFGDRELLGFGGFGKVYKGTLPGSRAEVAVKRVSRGSKQGIREFVAEIQSIGRLRHRNLVQLLGWCRRRDDLLLVYEHMANGSLDKFLFHASSDQKPVLPWAQRYRILHGVASALLYLHEEWEHTVIHRDVKASNVLLDAGLNGRLGDFGLAKLCEHGADPTTTRVVGTLGYLAPELTRTGKFATSSDVFAFGALALETLCGRKPIEPKAPLEELVLVDWVRDRWSCGRWTDVVDRRMDGCYDAEEVEVVIKVGLLSSHPVAEKRPTMKEVVRYFQGGDAPEVVITMPEAESGKGSGRVGFDDFVHSYSSSPDERPLSVPRDVGAFGCSPVPLPTRVTM